MSEKTYYLNKEISKLQNFLEKLDNPEELRYEIENEIDELKQKISLENSNLVANFLKAIDLCLQSNNKIITKKIKELVERANQ